MGKQITVREVNPKVFQEFKADAILHEMTVGQALTLAMMQFMQNSKNKKNRLHIMNFKP